MIAKILLYSIAIAINLWIASKREGLMKRSMQVAAALWGMLGLFDIYSAYVK